jgi:hypothetical protein
MAIVISLLSALAAAAVMWGWWRSPIPTFLVFTPVLHGMMLGAASMWIIDRLGIRSRARRVAIGLAASIVSLLALTFAQYLTDAHDYRDHTQQAMAIALSAPSPRTNALDYYDRNLLEPVTGQTGLIGYLRYRNAPGWRRHVRAAEALLVIGITTALCLAVGGRRAATVD